MNVVDGSGEIVPEPDWPSLLDDVLEIAAAQTHWRRLVSELRERDLLSPANAHAMQRLVCTYLVFDRASKEVAEHGAVTKPKRGNSKAIARVSPHFTVMREAGSDAASIEAELGLSPRRRAGVTKVDRVKKAPRAADRFLRAVS